MNWKILYISIWAIFLTITVCHAGEGLPEVGSKVRMLRSSNEAAASIYLYTDVAACNLCMQSVGGIVTDLRRSMKIDFKVFVLGLDNEGAERYREQWPSASAVIADELGLYRDNVSASKESFYIALGKDGKVLAVDKSGGQMTAEMILAAILSDEGGSSAGQGNGMSGREQASYSVDLGTYAPSAGRREHIYDRKHGVIYTMLQHSLVMVRTDVRTGESRQMRIDSVVKDPMIGLLSASWAIRDSLLLVPCNAYDDYRKVMTYDVVKDTFTTLDYYRGCSSDTTVNISTWMFYDTDRNGIIANTFSVNRCERLTASDTNIRIMAVNGRECRPFRSAEPEYRARKWSGLNYALYRRGPGGQLYEWQNLIPRISLLDGRGRTVEQYPLSLDTTVWRTYRNDFPYGESRKKIDEAYNQRSFIVDYDCSGDRIVAIYNNYTFGDTASVKPYTISYGLYRGTIDGKRLQPRDLRFPDGVVPAVIDDRSFLVSTVEGSTMKIGIRSFE